MRLTWKINWDDRARKELRKLDKQTQKKILSYIKEKTINNPRDFGKALSYDKKGLWRYRVGDYRIICSINDNNITILVLAVGHRKNTYK